jgi:hypothetical protein
MNILIYMEKDELTIPMMVERLGGAVSGVAINSRLKRHDRRPHRYIGSAGIYWVADMEAIRDGGTRGRPKASGDAPQPAPKSKPAPKAKPKKPPKI